jgi:hypothetical protein
MVDLVVVGVVPNGLSWKWNWWFGIPGQGNNGGMVLTVYGGGFSGGGAGAAGTVGAVHSWWKWRKWFTLFYFRIFYLLCWWGWWR